MAQGILFGGTMVVDLVKVIDVWPEQGTLANIVDLTTSVGGCALNNPINLKVLDPSLRVGTMGLVGDDDRGKFIRRTLESRGVEQAGVHVVEGSTSYSDVMTAAASGRRTFFHDRGVCARWSYEHVPFDAIPGRWGYVQLGYQLLLDGMDEPDPDYGTAMGRTLARFKELGLKTSMDMVSEESDRYRKVVLPSLPHVDDLIINEVEASRLTGVPDREPDGSMAWANLDRMADALFAAGVGRTVIVHFPEGAFARERDGSDAVRQGSHIVPPEDIRGDCGAGDAFSSGAVYGLAKDWSLLEAVRLGTAMAALNLRDPTTTGGARPLDEVSAFMESAPCRELEGR